MTTPKTGPTTPGLHLLYIPAVCALIAFQGYFSQYLFNTDPDLAPGPLTRRENYTFNILLACLWFTYYRACTVDPGRYVSSPTSSLSSSTADPDLRPTSTSHSRLDAREPTRWCKKCVAPKPLRAHHCRHCARCIPKMDHHCPWTGACVSMQTFPYFLRFLVYTNLSLWYLASLIWQRAAAIWADRHLPAYLGPSLGSLIGLAVLALANFGTSFALGILLYTTVKGWVFNSTMIEDWEMERHEALLGRMRDEDEGAGEFWGDDGTAMREMLARIEYPYDLGFFANMAQAMGTRNPLQWFLPIFGGGPVIDNTTPGKGVGWEWEENGFNDLPGLWPPPDPEKTRQAKRGGWPGSTAQQQQQDQGVDAYQPYQTQEEIKAAFARRQEEDLIRRQQAQLRQAQQRSGIITELEELDGEDNDDDDEGYQVVGKPLWTNSDGDRLWDYGVDEDVEETIPARADDEDVPLAELMRRRKVLTREDER
ncbi:DHHC palmitoyltransferase-domain-containing protein [Dichotomopilus funicola]|uniref:Palmitoyltransferase PFA4 n=1 Tax=Dichotomopilus funicola TaxID=1934379 RepID=A0AAN6ZRX3_9PEZI|nr:DHHC palmitoyltransferase-domain-containing protein [Dichotomopilus funicola]